MNGGALEFHHACRRGASGTIIFLLRASAPLWQIDFGFSREGGDSCPFLGWGDIIEIL
jgi:hypothetical protein